MKQTYQKPVINKHRSGLMNKFGWSPVYARKIRTEIDGVPIDRLVEQFGSPLFVYSERAARRKYRRMFNAFSTRYPNVVFGWSYKTNYLQAICALMHKEGPRAGRSRRAHHLQRPPQIAAGARTGSCRGRHGQH